MTLVYVDTNVIMDFLEGRDKSAYDFFLSAISCKYDILISDVVLRELDYQKQDYHSMLELLSKKLRFQNSTKDQRNRVKSILSVHNTHFNDALHGIVASDANVDFFVTRNKKDFNFLENVRSCDEL
jgi:predicted nucleic acid-binding protein